MATALTPVRAWRRIRSILTRSRTGRTESDVRTDPLQAQTRSAGGQHDHRATDSNSTTGTTPSSAFVGRVSGQDVGYAGMTGAEARAIDHQTAHKSTGQDTDVKRESFPEEHA